MKSIRKNKKEIVCFPWNWIKGTLPSEDDKVKLLEIKADVEMELFTQKDGFMRGITIFYLVYILAAENPDNLKSLSVFDRFPDDKPKEHVATERILNTYNAIKKVL